MEERREHVVNIREDHMGNQSFKIRVNPNLTLSIEVERVPGERVDIAARELDRENHILRDKLLEERHFRIAAQETARSLGEENEKLKLTATELMETDGKVSLILLQSKLMRLEEKMRELKNIYECGICTELYVMATTLNCGHTYCHHCINEWKRNNNACPLCRMIIESESRSHTIDSAIDSLMKEFPDEERARKVLVDERRKHLALLALQATNAPRLPRTVVLPTRSGSASSTANVSPAVDDVEIDRQRFVVAQLRTVRPFAPRVLLRLASASSLSLTPSRTIASGSGRQETFPQIAPRPGPSFLPMPEIFNRSFYPIHCPPFPYARPTNDPPAVRPRVQGAVPQPQSGAARDVAVTPTDTHVPR